MTNDQTKIEELWQRYKANLRELDEMDFAASRDGIFETVDSLLQEAISYGRGDMILALDATRDYVQSLRDEGEGDLRNVIAYINKLSSTLTK